MLTTTRGWSAATAVVAVLLVVAAWFLAIEPTRAAAAATREQTVAAESANTALAVRLEQLEQQFVQLPAKEAELAAVRTAMPEDAAIPELIRIVNAYAAENGVTIMSLAPGAPVTLGTDPTAATTAPAAPAATPADAAPVPADAAPLQPTGPAITSIPLVTTVVGDYAGAKGFLQRLQTGTRAHLVTNLQITAEAPAAASGGKPTTRAGDVTMVVTGSIFTFRDPSAAPSATAAPVPGAAPTAAAG
jgi:hypothetical protein